VCTNTERQEMKALKLQGSRLNNKEDAQDSLEGISKLPGFIFGYVCSKSLRVISFHKEGLTAQDNLPRSVSSVNIKLGKQE